MLKKILLLLDPSVLGQKSRSFALSLAKDYQASLTALGVLDTPWITAAQPEPLGGSIFKIQRDEEVIKSSQESIHKMMDDFKAEAESEGILYSVAEGEGFPSVIIERLSHEHDVIVIGQTTDIHFDLDEDSDVIVDHIARDNPRPIIIVPKEYSEGGQSVVVAQDGSNQASRALHMLLLLGLAKNKTIEIVCVQKDLEMADLITARNVRMCQAYGIEARAYISQDERHVAEVILERVQVNKPSLVCMGGFSHSALRDALFGSTTKTILKKVTVPVFVHH